MAKTEYTKNENDRFVNPYNFIQLGDKCTKDRDYYKEKKDTTAITGWLECELNLKSPVFIPNSSEKNYFQKSLRGYDSGNSYEFFSYDNLKDKTGNEDNPPANPVIPGSEIRGMIRSAFEALTNSCLSTTDKRTQLYKRTPKSGQSGNPGILRKNGDNWEIVPCDRLMIKTKNRSRDNFDYSNDVVGLSKKLDSWEEWRNTLQDIEKKNASVWVDMTQLYKYAKKFGHNNIHIGNCIKKLSFNPINGYAEGNIHVTAGFQRKHHDSVFVPNNNRGPISITAKVVQNYIDNLKRFLDNDEFKDEYKHLNKGDSIEKYNNTCLYYTKYNETLYLSPSMITCEMFYNTMNDLLGSYKPCEKPDCLCPACTLFGMVSDNDAVSSRIRFTDARVKPGTSPEFIKLLFLQELSSPKPSATEFYLKKPDDAHLWNYDYAMQWEGKKSVKLLPQYKPEIRGRKFYWHGNQIAQQTEAMMDKKDAVNKQKMQRINLVRPLSKGEFRFRVFFDRVSEQDLNRLIWVLTIGNSDSNAHKIGMGKPLGLGSVQIRITKKSVRIISFDDTLSRVVETKDVDYNHITEEILGSCNSAIKEYKELTSLHQNHRISYPYVKFNGKKLDEHYEWFVGNKQVKNGKGGKPNTPNIEQELPRTDNPNMTSYIKKIIE